MPKIEYTNYYSHFLGKSVNIEITGHFGYPILMFPTSKGSYTQNHDFGLNDSISWLIDQGKIKLYNIQTNDEDSLYNREIHPDERIQRYQNFVGFITQEYIPYIQKLHSTHRVAVAGASFGGYHASNLAFRFPDLFSHLFCLSGAFTIRSFMDGYDSDLVYFNCPIEFMRHDESWKFQHMNIILSTSDEDICREGTLEMANILNEKEIPHWYDEQKWISHDWPLWKMVFPNFIGTYFS